MNIQNNVPLANFTTMRLGGPASFLTDVENKIELQNTVKWAKSHDMPMITLGGGSNIIFRDEGFSGVVIINKIPGFEVTKQEEEHTLIKIGAGEVWDDVADR